MNRQCKNVQTSLDMNFLFGKAFQAIVVIYAINVCMYIFIELRRTIVQF